MNGVALVIVLASAFLEPFTSLWVLFTGFAIAATVIAIGLSR
jgi:hypothetical protein